MRSVSRAGGLRWPGAFVLGLTLLVACRPAREQPPRKAPSAAARVVLDGGLAAPRPPSLPVVFPLRPYWLEPTTFVLVLLLVSVRPFFTLVFVSV